MSEKHKQGVVNSRHYEKYDKPKLSSEVSDIQIPTDKIKAFISQPHIKKILTKIENEIKSECLGDASNIFHGSHRRCGVVFAVNWNNGEIEFC